MKYVSSARNRGPDSMRKTIDEYLEAGAAMVKPACEGVARNLAEAEVVANHLPEALTVLLKVVVWPAGISTTLRD